VGRRVFSCYWTERLQGYVNDKELAITKEGLAKLEDELDDLKTVHRAK